MGLIRQTVGRKIEIANAIYKENIPRELTLGMQSSIVNQEQEWYLQEDNTLDMPKLLKAFQHFFRTNFDSWIEKFDYKEAGPQLLLQAFLQRLINGGGRINREYGLGRKRTDIFVEWSIDREKGLEQTLEYGDIVGADELYLIIFNRDKEVKWEEKIWHRKDKSGIGGVKVLQNDTK